jgi:tRNA(Ile)-lysidine synthase TilS/MesJ
MRICARCVLPETFPGITFDHSGTCNVCLASKESEAVAVQRERYRRKFDDLLEKVRGTGTYDCLLSYSGGKDSSYTLQVLARDCGLRVLAHVFDNGFVSPRATDNVRRVADAVGADLVVVRPSFDMLRDLFAASLEQSLYPAKALTRASSACMSCISLVKFSATRMAAEKRIPLVAFGWSPGQAPIHASVLRMTAPMLQAAQQAVQPIVEGVIGARARPFFLEDDHFRELPPIYYVHPLAFLPYDEAAIIASIRALGWQPPDDTDPNSSNCLLNCLANRQHRAQYGFHPYAAELAGLVREGMMNRAEALERLDDDGDERMIELARRRLGSAGTDIPE